MSEDDKLNYIVPFTLTSIFRDQLINLEEKREGVNIILEQSNKNIKKDKVSSGGYALWWIKVGVDDEAMKKKTTSLTDMMDMAGSGNRSRKGSLSNRITFKGNRKYGKRR